MRHMLVTPDGPAFQATCMQCGIRMRNDIEGFYADLDGEAYRAYYCPSCTAKRTAGFSHGMRHGI